MKEDLTINTKLFSFKGILGRHDFFLNLIYISMIGLFVIIPLNIYVACSMDSIADLLNINKLFLNAPMFLKIWTIAGYCVLLPLYISTYFRRLNDINGKVNYVINILCVIPLICSYLLISALQIGLSLITSFIVFLVLLFKEGKITSQLPYDYKKEFNWGAFFGTWLWGLYNKSYITLLNLILWFTPWGAYFKLICGLKGNEWAFKNKKWNNVTKFNRSQERQTTFWVIFAFVITPLLWFLFTAAVLTIFTLSMTDSENGKQNMSKIEKFVDSIATSYFQTYSIGENKNSFYVLNSDWKTYSFDEKIQLLRTASKIAANEKNKKENAKEYSKRKYYYSYDELKITKIYSADNGKLLGEYQAAETKKDAGFLDIVKDSIKSFKFYDAE